MTQASDDKVRAELTPDGLLGCRSCPRDLRYPARYMATPKRTTGEVRTDWPLCEAHVQYAMVAGWFPIEDLTASQEPA